MRNYTETCMGCLAGCGVALIVAVVVMLAVINLVAAP